MDITVCIRQQRSSLSSPTSHSKSQEKHKEGSMLDNIEYYCWKQGSNSGNGLIL